MTTLTMVRLDDGHLKPATQGDWNILCAFGLASIPTGLYRGPSIIGINRWNFYVAGLLHAGIEVSYIESDAPQSVTNAPPDPVADAARAFLAAHDACLPVAAEIHKLHQARQGALIGLEAVAPGWSVAVDGRLIELGGEWLSEVRDCTIIPPLPGAAPP